LQRRRSSLARSSVALAGILATLSLGFSSDQAQARTTETKSGGADSSDKAGVALGGAIQNESASDLARDFDAVASSGARWVRIDINWDLIQRAGPSTYNWAPFDRVVSAARARGLNVLAIVLYTPPWARPAGTGATTPPVRLKDYVAFARTVAGRYASHGVHAYEIWNEANNSRFWQPRPDAARYTAMLKAASAAIQSVDAEAFIVTAGTSPALDQGGNIAPVTFLRQIYARGGKDAFDAVGHHPYCTPAYPGDAQWWSAWYQMSGAQNSLRSVMAANGDRAKQIWATEFGAPTGGPSGSSVSESVQAKMLTRAYKLFGSYRWAGPLFWYSARDHGMDRSTREDFYGLLRHDFSAKPALKAYKALTAVR